MSCRNIAIALALAACSMPASGEAAARGGAVVGHAGAGGFRGAGPILGTFPGAARWPAVRGLWRGYRPHLRGAPPPASVIDGSSVPLGYVPQGYVPQGYAPQGYAPYGGPASDIREEGAAPGAPIRRQCGWRVYHVPAEQGGERAITVTYC
jgi:hypothetical protein